ncbi:hypothetical protein V8E36_008108 [Tilletia maclaganii]
MSWSSSPEDLLMLHDWPPSGAIRATFYGTRPRAQEPIEELLRARRQVAAVTMRRGPSGGATSQAGTIGKRAAHGDRGTTNSKAILLAVVLRAPTNAGGSLRLPACSDRIVTHWPRLIAKATIHTSLADRLRNNGPASPRLVNSSSGGPSMLKSQIHSSMPILIATLAMLASYSQGRSNKRIHPTDNLIDNLVDNVVFHLIKDLTLSTPSSLASPTASLVYVDLHQDHRPRPSSRSRLTLNYDQGTQRPQQSTLDIYRKHLAKGQGGPGEELFQTQWMRRPTSIKKVGLILILKLIINVDVDIVIKAADLDLDIDLEDWDWT